MSIQRVKEYFRALGMEGRVLELDMSSATVELAAQALGCRPCRIAKTLSFLVEGRPILIVAAGDAKVDNQGPVRHKGQNAYPPGGGGAGGPCGGRCVPLRCQRGRDGLSGRIPQAV